MKDFKIIDLLKTFTAEELKDFEKFILSPLFRKRDVTDLFDVLKPFYPVFDDKKFTSEYVYKKLFPDKKYNSSKSDSHLRTLASDLFLSGKEFLIHIELNNHQNFRDSFLLNQLRKRNLNKEFLKESALINNKPINQNRELIFHFIERSYIYSSELEFNIDKGDYKNAFESLTKQSEYIAVAAIIRGLKFFDQKDIAEIGYNIKIRYNLVENFIEYLDINEMIRVMKENKDLLTPYIEIYYTVYLLLKHKYTETYFYDLKRLLLEYNDLLPQSDKYMLYSICTAFCDRMVTDKGILKFKIDQFDVYKSMLGLGVYKYSSQDFFQISLFRAMLISARVNKELDWMKDLIDNYSKELNPDFKETMKFYSLGQYYFAIGENEKALESLIRVKSDYFLYKKDLKNLIFRIYYNLGYFEEAFTVLDNLKHYLTNTKDLSDKIKIVSMKFVKYANQLLKLKTGNKNESPDFLIKSLESEQDTESFEWLLENAKVLKKK